MAWRTAINDFDARFKCLYCRNDLIDKKWFSEFIGNLHYKTTKCNCGKHTRVKLNFLSSGRDSWFDQNFNRVESSVKRLEDKVENL